MMPPFRPFGAPIDGDDVPAIVGELYSVNGTMCLLVDIDVNKHEAAMHVLRPLERILVQIELCDPNPFQGRLPMAWLESRLVRIEN